MILDILIIIILLFLEKLLLDEISYTFEQWSDDFFEDDEEK